MFEKIKNVLFSKSKERKSVTLIREKRDIKDYTEVRKERGILGTRDDVFWENRGKAYAALFNSLNGRVF